MKVNTNELLRQSEQFLDTMNRMLEIRDAVQKVDRNLSRERTGERFHESLTAAAAQIERQARDLRSLQKALEQIAEVYSSCETRIVDRTEGEGFNIPIEELREVLFPDFGRGLIPVSDLPEFEPIDLDNLWRDSTATNAASAIDWTPWDPVSGGNG